MKVLHVYKRHTFKYRDGYRDLDRHTYLGDVKLTPRRQTRPPSDFDDGGTYVRFATLPAGLSKQARREAREVIAENLSYSGCKHEYDCCGCESAHTRAYPTAHARRVLLVTSIGYNY